MLREIFTENPLRFTNHFVKSIHQGSAANAPWTFGRLWAYR